MRIAVVSLFPDMLRDALRHGVIGRALERGLLEVACFDPREHTTDVHRTVDDRPYGGGPGMVMKVEPLRGATRRVPARLFGCGWANFRSGPGTRGVRVAGIDPGGRPL